MLGKERWRKCRYTYRLAYFQNWWKIFLKVDWPWAWLFHGGYKLNVTIGFSMKNYMKKRFCGHKNKYNVKKWKNYEKKRSLIPE